MIRILHLSDFHYKDKHDADFQDVGSKIADAIRDEHIDLVVFSGDLVYDTEQSDKIDKAANCLIEPIKAVTGLSNDRILIAPGNHDMKIGAELPMIKQNFSTYNTYMDIDNFASNPLQLELSLENFKSYNSFISNFYGENADVHPLYVCHTPVINGCKLGLIAFNSSWRCAKSNEDRGKLVYPVFMVREALEKVKDCDFVICTQHHNLSDYTNSVGKEIESLINEKSHMLLTGHYHRGNIQTTLYSEIGLLHLTAPATYNRNDKASHYGFNIIEMDTTIYEGTLFRYCLSDGTYKLMGQKEISVPVSGAQKELNEFHKLVRIRHNQIKGRADELFQSGREGSFDELFVRPVLARRRAQELNSAGDECEVIASDSLLEKGTSAIIFGSYKSGRTMLLHWLQLETLKHCDTNKTIPFYINYQKYKNGKELNLQKELSDFLRLDGTKIIERFSEYRLLLLVDNMNPLDAIFVDSLRIQMALYKDAWFVATMAEAMSRHCALLSFGGMDVDMFHIHDITGKEVHQLVMSWSGMDFRKKQMAEEKIMRLTKQLYVPLSFWTTSLFLKVFAKTDQTNIHDNFALTELYMDELLNKGGFIRNQEFIVDYDDVKSYMAELAETILHSEDYALSDKELNDFTEDFKPRNRDFNVATWDIIRYLLDHHVIHKVKDKYTICLNGVFEFMLAFRMTEHEQLLHDVICEKTSLINFGNELGYYAGFKKNDFNTISAVFNNAKDIMMPLMKQTEYQDIDKHLQENACLTQKEIQLTAMLLEQLNDGSIKELSADTLPPGILEYFVLKPKVHIDTVPLNAETVEKILFTLSRMYRNSNVCDDQVLERELLDFILTGTCILGLQIMEETEDFCPIILQRFLYNAIHQQNLHDVFASRLEEMLKDPNGNQMRIFLLAFLLVDMDIKKNFELIDKATAAIGNKVLRFAILNKIISIAISNSDNPAIKEALQPKISELAKEFDINDTLIFNELLFKTKR